MTFQHTLADIQLNLKVFIPLESLYFFQLLPLTEWVFLTQNKTQIWLEKHKRYAKKKCISLKSLLVECTLENTLCGFVELVRRNREIIELCKCDRNVYSIGNFNIKCVKF